ncbi:MAG TPA: HPF/RaiA family ribosome-associated protein, partial [Gammaproteobacteria bacterium]|nr:HPF/RaiA family ribosome-associated protein [Gammaproteobacteria bacterium]
PDAYASAEEAFEHLEKRVRRYKRRLKNHHHGKSAQDNAFYNLATDYVVQPGETEAAGDDNPVPVIISENERRYVEMAVSEAVMQLDLADDPVIVFRNAAHGGLNIVYRRKDGNIGWIDPEIKKSTVS